MVFQWGKLGLVQIDNKGKWRVKAVITSLTGLEYLKLICHPSKMSSPLPALKEASVSWVKAVGSLTQWSKIQKLVLSPEAGVVPCFNRGCFHVTLLSLGIQCLVVSQHSATAETGWEARAWWEMELETANKALDSLGCWKPCAWNPGSLKVAGSAPVAASTARILPYIFILIYEKISHCGI